MHVWNKSLRKEYFVLISTRIFLSKIFQNWRRSWKNLTEIFSTGFRWEDFECEKNLLFIFCEKFQLSVFFISNFRVKPVERRFDTWKRWKRRLGLISNSKIANFYLNATNHTENNQSKYEFVQEIMSWTKTWILRIDLSLNNRLYSKAYNNGLEKWPLNWPSKITFKLTFKNYL